MSMSLFIILIVILFFATRVQADCTLGMCVTHFTTLSWIFKFLMSFSHCLIDPINEPDYTEGCVSSFTSTKTCSFSTGCLNFGCPQGSQVTAELSKTDTQS
jgi:hypothetical protein